MGMWCCWGLGLRRRCPVAMIPCLGRAVFNLTFRRRRLFLLCLLCCLAITSCSSRYQGESRRAAFRSLFVVCSLSGTYHSSPVFACVRLRNFHAYVADALTSSSFYLSERWQFPTYRRLRSRNSVRIVYRSELRPRQAAAQDWDADLSVRLVHGLFSLNNRRRGFVAAVCRIVYLTLCRNVFDRSASA